MATDPREIPTYTLTDAARYLRISPDTLRRWVKGYEFSTKSGASFSKPLIEISGDGFSQLSFYNLVEAHILSALRRKHNITMPKVRHALDYLKKKYPSPHPLADYSFVTDGIHIFIDQFRELEIIDQHGQLAIRELLEKYLRRVERDERKLAVRLFPYTSKQEIEDVRLVVIDPRVSFGRPVITGSGVATFIIAERFESGESIEELSRDYIMEREEIEEAIRCEYYWKAA